MGPHGAHCIMLRGQLDVATWGSIDHGLGGRGVVWKQTFWMRLGIKYGVNYMLLTALSVVYKFNDYILKKKVDP